MMWVTKKEYGVDVLIYPSLKGKFITAVESANSYTYSPCYTIAPMTGMPAITVPMGFDSTGLPYGLEIVGKQNEESTLYEIAYSYEKATNNDKKPDAPSLYEIPSSITDLKKYYEMDSYKKEMYKKDAYNDYLSIKNEIGDYLKNYNTKEASYSDELLQKYEDSISTLEKNKRFFYGREYLYWIFGGVFILAIILIIPKKRRK